MADDETLRPVDIMALKFLERGPHTMDPVVKDESEMAAGLLFIQLEQRGLVSGVKGDAETRGPTYTITAAGRRAAATGEELARPDGVEPPTS